MDIDDTKKLGITNIRTIFDKGQVRSQRAIKLFIICCAFLQFRGGEIQCFRPVRLSVHPSVTKVCKRNSSLCKMWITVRHFDRIYLDGVIAPFDFHENGGGGICLFCLKPPLTDNAFGISDPSYGSFVYENIKMKDTTTKKPNN